MIIGVGTDIVEIVRIQRLWDKQGRNFAERILTEEELEDFVLASKPEHFLAKRWSAKEAIAKAIGTGISTEVGFQTLHIQHTDKGQPYVKFIGALAERAAEESWHLHLSISDEKHYAIAMAVLEKTA